MRNLTILGRGVGQLLKERGHTIVIAESSAGGLISAALLSVPGASAYFLGGGVIYTHAARRTLLSIADEPLTGMRPSSEPYALLLARTVRERFGSVWGLSETGATGPTGNPYGDAAGHACFGLSGPIEKTMTLETERSEREENMWAFTKSALEFLEAALRETHR